MYRYMPLFNNIKNIIDQRIIGNILAVNVYAGQYLPNWRSNSDYRDGVSANKSLGGGVLLELSHEIDYVIWLFGVPKSVICSAPKISNLEIDVEDIANIIFEYEQIRISQFKLIFKSKIRKKY